MAVGTALSRLTGLGRVFALSYALGVTPLADSYNLANTAPNIVYDLVVGGVLSATLVPVFVELTATREDEDAWSGISAVASVATVVLLVASLLVALAAPVIVRGYTVANSLGVASQERAVATALLRMFAPQVFFYGVITLATAVLNTRRRFAAPMFVPIVNNLVVIAVLLVAGTLVRHASIVQARHDHAMLTLLGLGTTAGVVVQALALLPRLRGTGARLRWRWQPRHPAVLQVLRLSGWTFGIVVGNQVALFVVLLLADTRAGGVSAYTYAYTFFQLPYGVIAVSIMSARQPAWAQSWAAGELGRLRREVSAALRPLLSVIVPVSAVLVVVSDPLIRLILGHGATTGHGAAVTGQVLAILALGLPGFCAYLTYIRVYQAMQDTRAAFWLYVVENGMNIALAVALYGTWGVQGIAASVSIAYTAAAVLAAVRLRRRLGAPGARALGRTPGESLRVALAASVPTAGLAWLSEHAVSSSSTVGSVLRLLLAGAVAAVAYLVVLPRTPAVEAPAWWRRVTRPRGRQVR